MSEVDKEIVAETSNTCSGSHKHFLETGKIKRSSATTGTGRQRSARSAEHLPDPPPRRRNPRIALGVSVQFVGGAEGWWRIKRGVYTYSFPSGTCLGDALWQVNGYRAGRLQK